MVIQYINTTCLSCINAGFKLPKCLRDKCSEAPKSHECKINRALKKAQVNAKTFYKHWNVKLDAIRSCDKKKDEMINLLKRASLFWPKQPKSQQDRLELKTNFIRQIVDPEENAVESKLGSSETNHKVVHTSKMKPTVVHIDTVLQKVRVANMVFKKLYVCVGPTTKLLIT